MIELDINCAAHMQHELQEIAGSMGVSVDALVAYFFAAEVVHT